MKPSRYVVTLALAALAGALIAAYSFASDKQGHVIPGPTSPPAVIDLSPRSVP